ncbi:MAG TPA: hypothetical protein VMV44_00225 [Rectinemataceae bacterium]|nr:hypothetical protein [Rectinemataceae bacterium]
MQPIDRWKHEFDKISARLERAESVPSARGPVSRGNAASAIRDYFAQSFRNLPRELLDSLLEGIEGEFAKDRDRALARCATLGSILLMDYDGGVLDDRDWDSIREAFSESGGELDLELLTYAMQLVLDKGRL